MPDRDDALSSPLYGSIFDVNLEPVLGSEIGKQRPALIVSNDINNKYSNTVTILPITSKVAKKEYPFEVLVPSGVSGLTLDSRIKADQIKTIDKCRLIRYRGILPGDYIDKVQTAIRTHLNIL